MTAAADTMARLKALRDGGGLSARASAQFGRLIDRLEAPVRVGVFGLPEAGKAAVLNALAGSAVLRPGALSGPVLVRRADAPEAVLVRADGTTADGSAETPFATPAGTLFAELGLPLAALERLSLLTVVADAAPREMDAALAWAAPRCDIALWCTRRWTPPEQRAWETAPDRLRNHALLVATGGVEALGHLDGQAGRLFPERCDVPLDGQDLPRPADARPLSRRLTGMIEAARTADLDAAAFLIGQHARVASKASPPARVARTDGGRTAAPRAGEARDRNAPQAAGRIADADRTLLSRMVWHIRDAAGALAADLPAGALTDDTAAGVLTRLQAAVDTLLSLADEDDDFPQTFPDLNETLVGSQELVQLLKIEGGPPRAAEAAVLLGQLHGDVDRLLAA